MANHPNRSKHAAIRKHLRYSHGVTRVRYDQSDDAWHAYGLMPNSISTGWFFAGYTSDLLQQIALERGE